MRMDFSGLTATPADLLADEMMALARRSDDLPTFVAAGTFTNWQRCRIATSEEDIER